MTASVGLAWVALVGLVVLLLTAPLVIGKRPAPIVLQFIHGLATGMCLCELVLFLAAAH